MRVPLSPRPHSQLLLSDFLILIIFVGMMWSVIVILICWIKWCCTYFHGLIGHLYIFLGEMSVQILCLFKFFIFLLLSSKSSLCILDIRSLSDKYLKVFSDSVHYLFTFLMVNMSFMNKSFLILMKPNFFIGYSEFSAIPISIKKSARVLIGMHWTCRSVWRYCHLNVWFSNLWK